MDTYKPIQADFLAHLFFYCLHTEADLPVAIIHLDQNGTGPNAVEVLEEVWPGNVTPSDGAPYTAQHYPFLWLVITSNIFAALNIVAAILCLIFNFIFRKRK